MAQILKFFFIFFNENSLGSLQNFRNLLIMVIMIPVAQNCNKIYRNNDPKSV